MNHMIAAKPRWLSTFILLVLLLNPLSIMADLFSFVKEGKIEELKAILSEGKDDVNRRDDTQRGYTPLHLCALHGCSVEMVHTLLSHGADPEILDDVEANGLGVSPLYLAASLGEIQMVSALLNAGANVNSKSTTFGYTPLHAAIHNGHLKDVGVLLVHKGALIDEMESDEDKTFLKEMSTSEDYIQSLLTINMKEENAHNTKDSSELGGTKSKAQGGDTSTTNESKRRKSTTTKGSTSDSDNNIWELAREGKLDQIRKLLQNGPRGLASSRNGARLSLCHGAAFNGDNKLISLLAYFGADVNDAANGKGVAPIHYASNHGHVSTVSLLISLGADVNIKTTKLVTPCHTALHHGRLAVAEVLIKAGADIYSKNADGEMPLDYVSEEDRERLVGLYNQQKEALLMKVSVKADGEVNVITETEAGNQGTMDTVVTSESELKPESKPESKPEPEPASASETSDKTSIAETDGDVQSIWSAVASGDETALKTFLTSSSSLSLSSSSSSSSSQKSESKIIKERNSDNQTLLHVACLHNQVAIADILINHEALLIDATDSRLQTPLHVATASGSLDCARYLISQGADMYAKDINGATPSDLISSNYGKWSFLQSVEAQLREVSSKAWQLLDEGKSNDLESFLVTVKHKKFVDHKKLQPDGISLLHGAILRRDLDLATRLIKNHGASVDIKTTNGTTPLILAASLGDGQTVRFLVNAGADVNAVGPDGMTPLHWSSEQGLVDVIPLLISKGASVNAKESSIGATPLIIATLRDNTDAVKAILENSINIALEGKLDIDARCNQNLTALHYAARFASKPTVTLLVKHNANTRAIATPSGLTPLHLCVSAKKLSICRLLLSKDKGMKELVNTPSNTGVTPLHLAASVDSPSLISFLLSNGALPNIAESTRGITPLHIVCSKLGGGAMASLASSSEPTKSTESNEPTEPTSEPTSEPSEPASTSDNRSPSDQYLKMASSLIQAGADIHTKCTPYSSSSSSSLSSFTSWISSLLHVGGEGKDMSCLDFIADNEAMAQEIVALAGPNAGSDAGSSSGSSSSSGDNVEEKASQ